MRNAYYFEILTDRYEQLLERTEALHLDLGNLVELLDASIEAEEEFSGISDPSDSNYSSTARRYRIRRDNLVAAISSSRQRVLH